MERIPCDIIRDLMPSCADGVASEATEKAVSEHIAGCEECRKAYEAMTGGEETGSESDKKELDFLKKNKKRNRRIALVSALAACFAVALAVLLKLFVIGSLGDAAGLKYIASVKGDTLSSLVSADGGAKQIKKLEYRELDGVVYVTPRTVLKGLIGREELTDEYTAKGDIMKVVFNDAVVYDRTAAEKDFSILMKDGVISDWTRWYKLSEFERLVSSTMPGYCHEAFLTWAEAVEFTGIDVVNPIEDELWFDKMNFVGNDKTGINGIDDGNLYHARLIWRGEDDGTVTHAELSAGYSVRIFKADPKDNMPVPNIRIVFTALLTPGENAANEYGLELNEGGTYYVGRSDDQGFNAVEIRFVSGGIAYSIRLIGSPAEQSDVEAAADQIIKLLFGTDGTEN
ncbi:MAG: zf-HC2 domain-containing protein [Clostridia bacterium]|nr:zf-HC2 domain-containing protein [Clostridia bacterium]